MAAGLREVRAPYFAFLDDDDYLLADHYLHLLRAMDDVASPAFGYSDILATDEPQAGGAAVSVWREGVAVPPLGRITDRISIHAFLAERQALEEAPFEEWDLATAEDALLVAFLLARSTPAHSAHASCVYVRGGGDGSDYLLRSDRAADELAFARAVAPLRQRVEVKFGEPQRLSTAEYLAPFESAVRRADLFTALRARPPGNDIFALFNDAFASPVSLDHALVSAEHGLSNLEASGGRVGLSPSGVTVTTPAPFAYAARLPLDLLSPARPIRIAVQARCDGGTFGLGLVRPDYVLACEARLEPVSQPVEVQLAWDEPGAPALVLRRLTGGEEAQLVIDRMSVAYPAEALAPQGSREQATLQLEALRRAPRLLRSSGLTSWSPGQATTPHDLDLALPSELALGNAPWAYVHTVALPEHGGGVLQAELENITSTVFLLAVDAEWTAVGERIEVSANERSASVLIEVPQDACRLVLQADHRPQNGKVTLTRLAFYLNP